MFCRRRFGHVWLGISDTATEGQWVSVKTNKAITYTFWHPREPNGKRNENCVMMRVSNGRWNDLGCHDNKNYVCKKGGEGKTVKG